MSQVGDPLGNGYLLVQDDYTGPFASLKLPIDDGSNGINNAQGSTLLVLPAKRHTKKKRSLQYFKPFVSLQGSQTWKEAAPTNGKTATALHAVDFTNLLNTIAQSSASDDASRLNFLRSYAGSPENTFAGIEKLLEYYKCLKQLEPYYSAQEGQSGYLPLGWYDAFFKERPAIISPCIQHEKAAVLYNVASVFSHLASTERQFGDNGLKTSAVYFLKAAGVLLFVRDSLLPRFAIKVDKFADLSEHTLTASIYAMIAQTHECYHERASIDQSSSRIVSMIAAQTGDFYDLALRHAQQGCSVFRARFPVFWIHQLKAKSFFFHSVAHFHAPTVLPEIHAVGERVTRLSLAKHMATRALQKARQVQGRLSMLAKANLENISAALLLADTANFQEYHQTVVDARLLAPLDRPKQPLAVPVPFESILANSLSRNFKPLQISPVAETHESINLSALGTRPDFELPVNKVLDDMLEESSKDDIGKLEELTSELSTKVSSALKQIERVSHTLAEASICLDAQKLKLAISGAKKASILVETVHMNSKLFPLADMQLAAEKLLQLTEKNHLDCRWVLDHVDPTQFSAAPTAFALIGPLRNACNLLEARISKRRCSLQEIRESLKDDTSDFDINDWSSGNLDMVLPFASSQAQSHANHTLREAKEALKDCSSLKQKFEEVQTSVGKLTLQRVLPAAKDTLSKLQEQVQVLGLQLDTLKTKGAQACEFSSEFSEAMQTTNLFLEAVDRTMGSQKTLGNEVYLNLQARKDSAQLLCLCLQLPLTTFLNTSNLDPYVMQLGNRMPEEKQILELAAKLAASADTPYSGDIRELFTAYRTEMSVASRALQDVSQSSNSHGVQSKSVTTQQSKLGQTRDLKIAWKEVKSKLSEMVAGKDDADGRKLFETQGWEPDLDSMGKISTVLLSERQQRINKLKSNWCKVLPTDSDASFKAENKPQRPNTSLGFAATEQVAVSLPNSRAQSPALSFRAASPIASNGLAPGPTGTRYVDAKVDEIMRENERLRSIISTKAENAPTNSSPKSSRASSPLRQTYVSASQKFEERKDSILDQYTASSYMTKGRS